MVASRYTMSCRNGLGLSLWHPYCVPAGRGGCVDPAVTLIRKQERLAPMASRGFGAA